MFFHHTTLVLGDGFRIKFYSDIWCGNNTLKDLFPSEFRIACEKEASIADFMVIVRDQIQWNIVFSKAAQDWEVGSFEEFFRLLYSMRPSIQGNDKLWWVPAGKGTFSVQSFYKSLT